MSKAAYLASLLLLLSVCQTQAQINLTNGLMAYYPFNGDDKDHSGNNNNPTFNNATPTIGETGAPNTAYHFDGATTEMVIPNNSSLQFGRQLTIFARVRAEGYYYGNCHGNNIISKGMDFDNYDFELRYDDAIYSQGNSCNGNPPDTLHENIDVFYSSSTLPYSPYIEKGEWYNITRVDDGTNVKLYINCELIITVPEDPSLNMNSPDSMYIGYYPNAAYPYWLNGDVDEIRLYNRALNTEEIQALNGCNIAPCWPDIADFSLTPPLCSGGTNVQLAAAYPDSISSIKWTLSDGSTATANTVDHTFAAVGSYTVKMAVVYNTGCTDSVSKVIAINKPVFDSTVILTPDTALCAGFDSLLLRANPLGLGFCWTPAILFSNSFIDTPRVAPTSKTTYYCTSDLTSPNMLVNGNFNLGDSNFVSDYYSVPNNNSGAEFNIGTSPTAWNSSLSPCVDHTTRNGNMMMVSGIGGYVKVWSETIQVQPNTNYIFSTWIESLSNQNPGILNFSINGASIGSPIIAPGTTCNWVQYSTAWNSGDSTNAVVSLVSQNQINGAVFALDDIYFGPFNLAYDSVTIRIGTFPLLKARGDTTVCGTYPVPLSASGAAVYSWSPGTNLNDSTIANPVANTSQTTNYVVSAFIDPGCVSKDTVVVTDLPLPVFTLSSPANADLCEGTNFTITATLTGVPDTGISYQWSSVNLGQGLSTLSSYSGTAMHTDTFYVAVFDSACKITDSLQTNLQVDTLPILTINKSNDIDCALPEAVLGVNGGSSYTWTPASTIDQGANTANPTVDPLITTTYTVSTVNGACTTVDSIEVSVDFKGQTSSFSVPSAFTPNGDGINDCLKLNYWGAVSNFEFSIYNRWGQRVFYTTSRDVCWDGTFNGTPQPPGAFIYQIKASSPCSASGYVFRKGTVTLIR